MNDYILKWNELKAMRGTKYCVNIEKEEISMNKRIRKKFKCRV